MKIIINTCKGREHLLAGIKNQLPEAIVNMDDFTDSGKFQSTAWFNLQRGWEIAEDEACVQLQDDIVLTTAFREKLNKAIETWGLYVIQFFSMRKADTDIGTRLEHGSTFLMEQCYYLPKGVARKLHEFSKGYYHKTEHTHCPSDICIAEFLKANKMNYIIWCPNLVDHLPVTSQINKKRTARRQSKTFVP
jgi:hypothetical protein